MIKQYTRVLSFARKYRPWIVTALLAALAESALAGAFTKLMQPLINEGFAAPGAQATFDIRVFALLVVAIFLLRGACGYLVDVLMARSGRGVARDLRSMIFARYLDLPASRFDREPVPSMLNRLGSDCEHVAQAAVDALKVMLQQALQVLAMLVVMLWTSWQVTAVVLLLAPLLVWALGRVGKRYLRLGHRIQESGALLLALAEQALSGHREVRIYGAQDAEATRYAMLAHWHFRLNMKVESTRGLSSAAVQAIGAVALAALLVVAATESAAGRLDAGGFVTIVIAMAAIIPALKQLAGVQGVLNRGLASADRLFEVLDAPGETDAGTAALSRAHGVIEFEHVTARYPGRAAAVLADVSFTARPGTVTAIVGRSGSGKSTLVNLVPRFHDIASGRILLDGLPLAQYRLADLRRQIAMVGQQILLFDGTVAENVAYGELAQAPAEALESALLLANALDFVRALPRDLDTRIGSRGGHLSGGQRQRLAIARAMLKDAPILILDEATAALDAVSERLVQDALLNLVPNRTTLVIAHRLSTIEHADQVLVLDQGRIVEHGTHRQLLARNGLYAQLHRTQFRDPQ